MSLSNVRRPDEAMPEGSPSKTDSSSTLCMRPNCSWHSASYPAELTCFGPKREWH